jgi:hypothetical protein
VTFRSPFSFFPDPFTLFLLPIVDIAQREGFLLNQELDDIEEMLQQLEEQGTALEKATTELERAGWHLFLYYFMYFGNEIFSYHVLSL